MSRGRGAELKAQREKKKKQAQTGSTTSQSSSVPSNPNRDGGGRTGGLTRAEVKKKVYNAPGYSQGSTIKAYQEKYPTSSTTQKSSFSQSNRSNRSNSSTTQNNTHRSRTSGSVERGREQSRIKPHTTAAELRKAQEAERLKRVDTPTAREMLAKRQDEEEARRRRVNHRRARDEEARSRMSKPATAMELRQQRARDLADGKDDKVTETIKTTGKAAEKGFFDAMSGHAQSALDALSGLTADEKRNYLWLRSAELNAGIDRSPSQVKKAARGATETSRYFDEERQKLNKKQEKRQAQFDRLTKNSSGLQKTIYGAAEAGSGMLTDMAVGAATGTGQAGSLASMFSRTYGTTRGQAQKEGATEREDRLYAGLQATKETVTELMFPGWGLAKGYAGKTGLKAGERLANALTRNMRGKAADVAYAGLRALGGTAEENIEEIAGWAVDPFIKEIAYGKNVRDRAKAQLLSDMPAITSREEAEALNARLNSSSFIDELAAEYIANGMPEKKARELARKMRDLYSAYYSGDTERIDELGDDVAGDLTGLKKVSKESFSRSELLETLASTTLLTATTGIPGAITTAQRGAELKSMLGTDGLKALAKDVLNSEDAEASERGKVAQAALAAGKEITSTQVYDLEQSIYQQHEKDAKRQAAQLDTAGNQIAKNNLVTPFALDERGRISRMEDATIDAYNEAAESAETSIKEADTKNSLTDTDVTYGARAIAGFRTGAFTIDDANAIVADEAVKQAFEEQTGIDLGQYEVKNKNGSINIPKTNAATKDALFAMASDNLVKMAEVETANWMDKAKGETVRQVTVRMGAKGSVAVQLALDDMDERDVVRYRNMAVVSDYVYQSALNIGVPWEDAKDAITSQFSSIPEAKLQMLYEAGLADRQAATDKMLGLQTKIGEAMSLNGEREDPTQGQCLVETKQTPKGSIIRVFSDIADSLGINIHLVDDLPIDKEGTRQANGQYIDGEIYINVNSTYEENLGYIFMHEVTHHLKKYAPEQYKALENLVREEWFKYSPEQMQSEIAKTIKTYEKATKGKQVLTEEEALEEIIADATHEFLMDKSFAKKVADKEPSLAKAVLESIREMLRRLRQIFSSGKYEDSRTSMNSFFSQIGILDEAERLWLDAYTEAVKNKAAVGVIQWQEEANKRNEIRDSISNADINELDQTNSIVEDNEGNDVARFEDNGSVSFSISSYDNEGREIYQKYLNKMVDDGEMSQKEADDMLNELETIYRISKDLADTGKYAPYTAWSYADVVKGENGKPAFSAIKKNSEYKMNIDFSTICKKRRTLDAVFREMIRRGMFELSELDLNKEESAALVVNINNLIREHKFEAACALCFVEARRYRQQQTAKTFADMWNGLVESMYKDKDKIAYFNFGRDDEVQDVPDGIHTMDDSELDLSHIKKIANAKKDGKPVQTAEAKAARLILNNPEQRKLMRVGDMMASTGFENMHIENPELEKVYNSKKGTGGAKASFGDVQYLNEIIKSKSFDRQKAYDVSGVRIQSFSDYVPRMVFDYVQVIADLAAKKLPAHAYTKEVLFALQFGLTGTKINLSLVPDVVDDGIAPGLDADGNYIWNEEGTFPWEDFEDEKGNKWPGARSIQKAEGYKENCGTIAVGISDAQIMKMLADPEIQMVIPYHKSSLNPIVAAMTNVDRFTDYTEFQNTKNAEGKTVKKDFDWDKKLFALTHYTRGENKGKLKPKDNWGDVQDLVKDYVKWCEDKNCTPKFSQFLYQREGNEIDGEIIKDEEGNPVINPGYYKMLEDFALYDNDLNFKPQGDVQMQFPTEDSEYGSMKDLIEKGLSEDAELEAKRSDEIEGIVDEIENMMKEGTLTKQSATSQKLAKKFSITPEMDEAYMDAVNSGNMEEAQKLVDQAAKEAGYNVRIYHGTVNKPFKKFKEPAKNRHTYKGGSGFIYGSTDKSYAENYTVSGEPFSSNYKEGFVMDGYMNIQNPLDIGNIDGSLFKIVSIDNLKPGEKFYEVNKEPDYSDSETIDAKATDEFKRVASIVGLKPHELIQRSDEETYRRIMRGASSVWDYVNQPEFARLVEEMGHDGIKATEWDTEVYGALRPNQYKSADAVTYESNGSVVPLSKRFDPNTDYIRYSLPTVDADDNVLSDGQMEYFKNSQARDEQGRLVPVYHATDEGGFTIFDPERSDDHRSLFFSNRRDVANTYVDRYLYADEDRLGDEELEGQEGYYQVYLNLTNPLIIDGTGQPWNDIVAGGATFPAYSYVTLKKASWFDEEAKRRDEMYAQGQSLINGDEARAKAKEFDNDDYVEIEIFNGEKTTRKIIPLDEEHITQEIIDEFDLASLGFDEFDFIEGIAEELTIEMGWSNYSRYYGDDMRSTIGEYGYDTREWAETAEQEGYDGVIFRNIIDLDNKTEIDEDEGISDIYVAFSSNQVKDTRNENPTENPDIRYSFTPEEEAQSRIAYEDSIDDSYDEVAKYEMMLDEGRFTESMLSKPFSEEKVARFYAGLRSEEPRIYSDPILQEDAVRLAKSKDEFFNNVNAKWNARWTTDGEVLKIESVRKDIRNLVIGTMNNSDTPAMYRNDIVRKTLIDARIAFQLMKQDQTGLASALLYHSAQRMIEGIEFIQDDTAFQEYKEVRDFLRKRRITVPEEYWENEGFLDFRKEYFGRLRLCKGKNNIADVYAELQDGWPHLFNESEREANDYKDDPESLLEHIGAVVDSNVTPFKEAYTSEAATELCFDIADELYEIIANGDRVVSLADTYKEKFDKQTKAMKERHQEALRKVREQRDEGIKKERAKWKVREEARKERNLHTKYFTSIAKSYKTLVDRLRTNTADKHIPEQYKKDLAGLLAAFDLQTVASKEREAKTFHRSQKAIQMSAIRTALRQIEAKSELFHVNDSITDIIDDLLGENSEQRRAATIEGKTLDELSASELQRIDKLLKALIHEFNTYENVRINARNVMAEDLSRAQVTSAIDHAKKFGAGTDWFGPRGWIDKILNMDEVTPAYMFKMIDPNNEGLGQMWKEIKRSHDRYIRNTDQLTQWMDEIIGKYHNKGKASKKYGAEQIENWRSSRYTKTFNLTNGSITLTQAQMMSVACLANRHQAYQHMIGAGVVAAPISFQNKMETDLKRKTNYALPLILTDADIKQIVTALTPEQKKVAEDLQQLMATKMAEWGNEASMDVIGIKLFEEPDYFPIKSDKAALQKDWTADQFDQAIRNFGFTKAVQPGARNAIVIDDIFEVVSEHCNNMNLYNAYSKTLNDFMKVYNKHTIMEDGADYSVAQAISHAYSQKATNFIMEFVKDLNGNVSSGKRTGIDAAMNDSLANAKKASVFANIRVFLQQPTAITRAFAVISPKYLKGVSLGDVAKGMIPTVTTEAMQEMFDHCPIALWKSWGYYDINMGKTIEDVIMNEGNWLEDLATDAYGKADNITWTAIWQMVKAEMKDTHPDVEIGTDEYWELCNERMSEIVDYTQVVDSPLHRSHAMRSKNPLAKVFTSFMAEPTLTFNMVRDAFIRAKEAWVSGDKAKAAGIMNKAAAVYLLQAVTVSAAAAIADALRKKSPDGDDDDKDKGFGSLWLINFLNNFKDEMKIWNKVYFIKDLASMLEGWDQRNLALQGWNDMFTGLSQMWKKLSEGSKTPWWKVYSNFLGGFGTLAGIPIKTLMRDGRAIFELFGGHLPESLVGEDTKSEPVIDEDSKLGKIISTKKSDIFSFKKAAASVSDSEDDDFNTSIYDDDGNISDSEYDSEFENDVDFNTSIYEDTSEDIIEEAEDIQAKVEGLDGEEKDAKIWSQLNSICKKENGDKTINKMIAHGEYDYMDRMKEIYLEAGGDEDYFDKKVISASKTALKKTISYDESYEQIWVQDSIKGYLTSQGVSDAEISEIAYKSDVAKDLKVAFRLNDEELMRESLQPLVQAGLTQEDLDKLWTNRNRMDLEKYKSNKGRYADKLKSMGTFIWPTQGVVTSHFGYRNAPTAGASSNHPAIDIGAAQGTSVVAADGGVVVYAGSNGGYGNSVGIKHDNGMVTYYNHLYSYNVQEGDTVAQGQQIAQVGSTGISTGPHLDFKILDKNGNPVDPEQYLN